MSHNINITSKRTHSKYSTNIAVSHGEIKFRLLCSTTAAGGVIGHSGAVIKNLERETFAKIIFDYAVSSSCKERLVHVIGSATSNRNIQLSENQEVVVSAAQDGLVRVFDRMLEVEPPEEGGGMVKCRLLVEPGLIGAVIGTGGRTITKVCKETRGYVKVFKSPEFLPPCANSDDQLIQITGDSLAVKKALVAVSGYIQQKTLEIIDEANGEFAVPRPSMKMKTCDAATNDNEVAVVEVVFKLLCPCNVAGAVLGFRGRKVKALEEKTGASIRFSVADGCVERVVTVSAFENRKSHHSAAQNALVHVFDEMMSSREKENVTAKLLIPPSQSGCLNVSKDSVISCISEATGATLQILEQKYAHAGASTVEKVIQIDGEHHNVQIALFQISWRLRERSFCTTFAKNGSPCLPHKLFNPPPNFDETAALTEKMKNFKVIEEVNNSLPSKYSNGHCLSTSIKNPRDLTTVNGGREHGSKNSSVFVTNTKMEIAVRADVFGSVFGDDGSNLSRLRTISGAKVELQDHCPESNRKVIISGTPDQTLVAHSLIQAFIMAAQ